MRQPPGVHRLPDFHWWLKTGCAPPSFPASSHFPSFHRLPPSIASPLLVSLSSIQPQEQPLRAKLNVRCQNDMCTVVSFHRRASHELTAALFLLLHYHTSCSLRAICYPRTIRQTSRETSTACITCRSRRHPCHCPRRISEISIYLETLNHTHDRCNFTEVRIRKLLWTLGPRKMSIDVLPLASACEQETTGVMGLQE